jgi:hypothetical protein
LENNYALRRRIARLRPAEPFAELARTRAMIEEAPASVRRTVADRTQHPVGRQFVLKRRASLLVSAGVVSHTLWTSAAPALTYGLYAQEWHLSHTVTAGIFAIYPIGVVVMLVGFGGISDQIGRRATMLAGLFASLAGVCFRSHPMRGEYSPDAPDGHRRRPGGEPVNRNRGAHEITVVLQPFSQPTAQDGSPWRIVELAGEFIAL